MSDDEKRKESEIFAQKLSADDLAAASGGTGACSEAHNSCNNGLALTQEDKDTNYYCTESDYRRIYEGGFPNCAATVEDGSWCGTNDACFSGAVVYLGISSTSCRKAWR